MSPPCHLVEMLNSFLEKERKLTPDLFKNGKVRPCPQKLWQSGRKIIIHVGQSRLWPSPEQQLQSDPVVKILTRRTKALCPASDRHDAAACTLQTLCPLAKQTHNTSVSHA